MERKRTAPTTTDSRDSKRQNTSEFKTDRPYPEVRANYWPIELKSNQTIFKYHFEFQARTKKDWI